MADAPKFQLFGIPNNEMGRAFIDQLRSFTNYERFRVRVRGNGPRASVAKAEGLLPGAYDQDIPLAKAATLRVYIEDKAETEQRNSYWQEKQALLLEIETLTRNVQDLQLLHQSLGDDARFAYSRGYSTMQKKVVVWLQDMPWWLRKALTYLYGEV